MSLYWFFFFFSSRRRHTRCSRDWSSDVCSSDLIPLGGVVVDDVEDDFDPFLVQRLHQIGRASCRESVDLGGRRIIKKKTKKERSKMKLSEFYAIAQIEYCRNFIFKH